MAKKEKKIVRNKIRCIRCGALKKSQKYLGWECQDEYCDTDTMLDWGYF